LYLKTTWIWSGLNQNLKLKTIIFWLFQENIADSLKIFFQKTFLFYSGSVIAPCFNFDVPKLKFGLVSYGKISSLSMKTFFFVARQNSFHLFWQGFKYSQSCILYNTSLVPMAFNLRALSDCESTRTFENESSSSNFKEFSIVPSTGTIPPQSEVKINVEFIPRFIKKYETSLAVDVDEVGDEYYLLPVTARSNVPNIILLTPSIDMGRCFIQYAYSASIRLSNETTLPARYHILSSEIDDVFQFSSEQAEVSRQ
jgi:hydrocephalus-inducing protein